MLLDTARVGDRRATSRGLTAFAGVAVLLVACGWLIGTGDVWPALALSVVVLVGGAVTHVRSDVRSLAALTSTAAVFMLPMDTIRWVEFAAVADVLLAIAAGLALLAGRSRPGRRFSLEWPALALLIIGGLAGAAVAGQPQAALAVGRIALAGAGMFVIVWRLDPLRSGLANIWIVAYASGSMVSAVVGLANPNVFNARIQGLSTHPNPFALTMVIAILLVVGARSTRLPLWARLGTVGFLFVALLSSGSRAGLLALVAGLLLLAVQRVERANVRVVIAALGVLLILVVLAVTVGGPAIDRLLISGAERSDAARLEALARTLERTTNPFLGNGFQLGGRGHNVYLETWASGGLLAVSGYVLLALGPVAAAFVARRTRVRRLGLKDGALSGSLASAAWPAAAGSYFVFAAFQNPLWNRSAWLVVAVGAVARVLWAELPAEPAPTESAGVRA